MKTFFSVVAGMMLAAGAVQGQSSEVMAEMARQGGPLGEWARNKIANPPLPLETPSDTEFRVMLKKAVEEGAISAMDAHHLTLQRDLLKEIRALRREVEDLRARR